MLKKIIFFSALLGAFLSNAQVIINEIDADTPGTDNLEFVELKSTTANFPLDGYVLVFLNGGSAGTSNLSYLAIDLDGYTTDINGIFLIGNSQVSPTPTYIIPNNTIQNGPDAVAIYHANGTDFPNNTVATATNLINGLAYSSSSSSSPTAIMTALGITTCEIDNTTSSANISIQHNNNGTYTSTTPTPGVNNDGSGTVLNHITITPSATTINEGDHITFTFTADTPVTGSNLIINMSVNNGTFNTLDINGVLTVYIPVGQTSVTNTLLVVNDTYDEGDEEMLLNVQSLPSGYVLNNNFITVRVNETAYQVLPFGTPANPTYGNVTTTLPNYYASVEGLAGAALKQGLRDLISNPAVVRVQNYDDIWEILKTADQNPARGSQVWQIYTEQPRSKIDYQAGTSIVGKWNREHIYCQSRGGYSTGTDYLTPNANGINVWTATTGANDIGAGVCDAHHIRAVDGQENSSRNNRNYGVDYNGPTATPTTSWKGDVARALFYMSVRYSLLNVVNGNPTDGTIGQIGDLATLLTWNHSDPADDFEMNRNNYIYTWQMNRNPFIDHPELADYIWGTQYGQVWHANLSTNSFADASSIIMYPNPAKTNFQISGLPNDVTVSIYTILGEKISNQKISNFQTIDVSGWSSGVYIVKFESDTKTIEKKLIVE